MVLSQVLQNYYSTGKNSKSTLLCDALTTKIFKNILHKVLAKK
jgi:hypothetical protein